MEAQEILGRGKSDYGIENHGILNIQNVYWNLSAEALYEESITRQEATITHGGALVVRTGKHTGRAAKDKYIVHSNETKDKVWWDNNNSIEPDKFEALYSRVLAYLQGKDIFIQDCYAGADPKYCTPLRVITENAWHNLFAYTMFLREFDSDKLKAHKPEFTIIHVPNFFASPELDGTKSQTFVMLNMDKKIVIIGGTSYAGEIKKSVFTIMNYILPQRGVMSMHCSANYGKNSDDVAIFFGLSGTGKTTLSADKNRTLIGDDEHGWSDHGVFNIEGGCYAKVIRLSSETEPEIFATTERFGTILENVIFDSSSRLLDLDSDKLTENTRGAYPVSHIPNMTTDGLGGKPKVIVMLTCDAFGVLPPIARLSPEQAMYHFISGYTAKVAGTEIGVTEPSATFSACFGAPFMPLHPNVYAKLLGERINKEKVSIWLLNTGWSGGSYGVGKRISLPHTRALVAAALNGELENVQMEKNAIFGFEIPKSCPNVPSEILNPRNTWEDKAAYDTQEKKLANMFVKNFEKFMAGVSPEIQAASPKV